MLILMPRSCAAVRGFSETARIFTPSVVVFTNQASAASMSGDGEGDDENLVGV